MARGIVKISSSSSAFYKELLSLWPHAASVPSIPCFPLSPLYAQTCSNKLTCIQEGCLCPQGKFHLRSAVCLLCPSDPLCNQTVCLQTGCLLCLLLLVHEVHLVTTCVLFNNHLYQLPSVLPITHIWVEESRCASFLGWSCCVWQGSFPHFHYIGRNFPPFPFYPQAGTLCLPVCNFPMLFSSIYDRNRLYPLFIAVAGAQITPPWNYRALLWGYIQILVLLLVSLAIWIYLSVHCHPSYLVKFFFLSRLLGSEVYLSFLWLYVHLSWSVTFVFLSKIQVGQVTIATLSLPSPLFFLHWGYIRYSCLCRFISCPYHLTVPWTICGFSAQHPALWMRDWGTDWVTSPPLTRKPVADEKI